MAWSSWASSRDAVRIHEYILGAIHSSQDAWFYCLQTQRYIASKLYRHTATLRSTEILKPKTQNLRLGVLPEGMIQPQQLRGHVRQNTKVARRKPGQLGLVLGRHVRPPCLDWRLPESPLATSYSRHKRGQRSPAGTSASPN